MSSKVNQQVILSLALVASMLLMAQAQGDGPSGPGMARGVIASVLDGTSRYFAPDGPVQPFNTAVAGLPIRAAEGLNNGITRISVDLRNGATMVSGGDGSSFPMPGAESFRNAMPEPITNMGAFLRRGISTKNNIIRGQAIEAAESADRLRLSHENGLQQ